jgi:hypothetical protein
MRPGPHKRGPEPHKIAHRRRAGPAQGAGRASPPHGGRHAAGPCSKAARSQPEGSADPARPFPRDRLRLRYDRIQQPIVAGGVHLTQYIPPWAINLRAAHGRPKGGGAAPARSGPGYPGRNVPVWHSYPRPCPAIMPRGRGRGKNGLCHRTHDREVRANKGRPGPALIGFPPGRMGRLRWRGRATFTRRKSRRNPPSKDCLKIGY